MRHNAVVVVIDRLGCGVLLLLRVLKCNFFVLETTPFIQTTVFNLAEVVRDGCRRVSALCVLLLLLIRLILDFDAHNVC